MILSRRAFLEYTLTLVAASSRLSWAEGVKPVVGAQLYGWGQYYERAGKKLADHLDEVFSAIRDAGYDYAEGFLDVANPEENAAFAEKFKASGLRPVCIYTGGRLHEPGTWETNVERIVGACTVCAREGYQVINCNPDPIAEEKTNEQLQTQAKALDLLGRELKKLGLELGVHNHTPEMRSEGREFHHNFQKTNPEWVGFCFDVHWVYRGGVPPMEALKLYGNRVVSWHLRQSRNEIWWEALASGDIDYGRIAEFARENDLPSRYTVELALEKGTKITRSVVANHRRSREFVKRVFGV